MINKIIILDFGSQYTQLIARRIRELEVYCQVWPFNTDYEKIKQANCKEIILFGDQLLFMRVILQRMIEPYLI